MGVGVGTQGGFINLLAADYRSRLDSISSTPTNEGITLAAIGTAF